MLIVIRALGSALTLLILAAIGRGAADARTLEVGPGKAFALPGGAIRSASSGDTIAIDPGEYDDCAVIETSGLTIRGLGEGATLAAKTCQEKAILVTTGHDIIVRNLTLAGARVPDQNGAGIRAEGDSLTVDHVRFLDNEEGILSVGQSGGTIVVRNSEFRGNGQCAPVCAHGIYVGHIALLHIEHSRFLNTRSGHHIKSRAQRTEILDNDIADGPEGTASYLVDIPDGGEILMRGNRLEKGPKASSNRVVMIGAEQPGDPAAHQVIENNTFVDDGAHAASLVINWGAAVPVVSNNTVPLGVSELSSRGEILHRLKQMYDKWKKDETSQAAQVR